MINWPVVRKTSIALIVAVTCTIIFVDMVSKEMLDRRSRSVILEDALPNVVVPKNKRYNDEITAQELQMSDFNMGRIDLIKAANSDPLPPRIFNGTADEMCSSSSEKNLVCLPKFKHMETRIRIAPKYKMMTCIIQKSMSTVMAAIMCFLFNENKFRGAKREFAKECGNFRFCLRKNEFGSVVNFRKRLHISEESQKEWAYTMITRDPVERFMSGFVDKCIRFPRFRNYCNGCGRNMTCFILTEYDRMVTQLKKRKFLRTFEDTHFFPQSWRCDLESQYDNYQFIRYSSDPSQQLLTDLVPILKKQGV